MRLHSRSKVAERSIVLTVRDMCLNRPTMNMLLSTSSKTWMNVDSEADCSSSFSFKPVTDDHSTVIMSDFVPQQDDSSMLEPGAVESGYDQPEMVSWVT